MKMKKIKKPECPLCSGAMVRKEVDFSLYGELLGRFKADVCSKCGEEFFDEETSKKIDEYAKKKGLYGLEANTKISEVGNSIAIRINKKLKGFFHAKKGEEVKIYPENKNRLIVDFPE